MGYQYIEDLHVKEIMHQAWLKINLKTLKIHSKNIQLK